MALISPSSFRYVLGLSLFSRILVLIIQCVTNILLTDHGADAYRNKYYSTLASNKSIEIMLPNAYRYLYASIEGMTKWDAQYFLEISKDGYVSEQHFAFLPSYPIIISLVKQVLFEHSPVSFSYLLQTNRLDTDQSLSLKALEDYIRTALVGVALNNFVFFPSAALALFATTKLAKGNDEKFAKDVIRWFCFNPASVFFSACYSESLFAALTFSATFILEYRSQSYFSKLQIQERFKSRPVFVPLDHLNRLMYITLPCLGPLLVATGTRSNGLVTIGFLAYQFLLKYIPISAVDRTSWSLIYYVLLIGEIIQDLLVLVMSSVIAASGYITFQIYSHIKLCDSSNLRPKDVLILRPDWCDHWLPHPYPQVQSKYWDVGLFKYYKLKQLPNFLLAAPISYLVLAGSLQTSRRIAKMVGGKRQLVYYIHSVVLILICAVTINIQVITRILASSCPVAYWICADLSRQSQAKSRVLLIFFTTYFVLGSILYPNFYPWT